MGKSSYNEYLGELVGKTIRGVVLKEGASSPRSQLFLLFDNCHFEFYSFSGDITPTRGMCRDSETPPRDAVSAYKADGMHVVAEAHSSTGSSS